MEAARTMATWRGSDMRPTSGKPMVHGLQPIVLIKRMRLTLPTSRLTRAGRSLPQPAEQRVANITATSPPVRQMGSKFCLYVFSCHLVVEWNFLSFLGILRASKEGATCYSVFCSTEGSSQDGAYVGLLLVACRPSSEFTLPAVKVEKNWLIRNGCRYV